MGAVIIFAIMDWIISGRKRFQVPVKLRVLGDEDGRSEGCACPQCFWFL